MLRIQLASPSDASQALPGLPSWMTGLLRARGISTEEEARRFLCPGMDQLSSPLALHQMAQARDVLARAREQGKKTVIYGDYDVDGVCASAILWEALGMLGMERTVYIPDRHREGYGLNMPAVESLAQENQVLVTVDCGIASTAEVQRARELGMDVIVTDHHRHGEVLPPACAVVSPLLGDFPFPYLCGAGVAWKLALALLGDEALSLMEIAAIATVADMVPLIGENRVITALGLKKLTDTRRPGLRAVMERAGIHGAVSGDQVAFQIAPRMNACGRMESARTALDLLLTRDPARAEALALKMEALNQERKTQEARVLTEALEQAERMDLVREKAIVVEGEGWNSGVVGLAAGRVAEKYAYPTVALAREGELCVGSARSAGDIDIHRALSRCAGLFERFGGHKQAAGLTMRAENVPAFRDALTRAVIEQTGGRPVIPQVLCDGEMRLSDVTAETVEWLGKLEPFGVGNPAPRFLCRDAVPLSFRRVGAEGRHLKCTFRQDQTVRDGIFFGGGDWAGRETGRLTLAISPTVNEFRGRVSAECRLYAMELTPESLPEEPLREAISLMGENWTEPEAEIIDESALDGLMTGGQGTLLMCRCRETALRLHQKYPEADFCLEKADDPRAFHTVLLYGTPRAVTAPFRQIVFCDGGAGDREAWRRAAPEAELSALPESAALRKLLCGSFVDVNGLRGCYAVLRRRGFPGLEAFAEAAGLTPAQGCFALAVLREIGLADVTFFPFRAALLPMMKRGPEESGLFRRARRIKEEQDGVLGI